MLEEDATSASTAAVTTDGLITAVAVGRPTAILTSPDVVMSGIVKRPIDGPVAVGLDNLAGDGQADLSVHGGRDKAIYVYSADHYPAWQTELGRELEPAQFGENLSVQGMLESDVLLGSRYRVGSAEVVIAQPRLPCFKLGIRMGDKHFPARFLQSGRLGFYLRVEKTGVLESGDCFELLEQPKDGISIDRLWRLTFVESCVGANCETVRRALTELTHLDAGWQRRLRGRLRTGGCG
ncbi:MAG: MOSC domain-containing protein [Pseudomonadota bacterium]